MKKKSVLILLIISILLPISAISQDKKSDESLDLDQVLTKYYEAIGGLKKWQGLNTMIMKGVMSTQGTDMPITAYHERPTKCRVEFIVKDTMMAQVYGGYFAWQINPLSGNPEPAPMTSGKTAYLRDTCDIDRPLIDYKKKGHRVKLLGIEEIDGKKHYKVNLKFRSGNIETYYIDTETFLLNRSVGIYNIDQSGIRTTTTFSDYKNTDGYIVPYKLIIQIHGAPSEEFLEISKFEFNPKIDSKMFDFPKEKIREMEEALKEQQKLQNQ